MYSFKNGIAAAFSFYVCYIYYYCHIKQITEIKKNRYEAQPVKLQLWTPICLHMDAISQTPFFEGAFYVNAFFIMPFH